SPPPPPPHSPPSSDLTIVVTNPSKPAPELPRHHRRKSLVKALKAENAGTSLPLPLPEPVVKTKPGKLPGESDTESELDLVGEVEGEKMVSQVQPGEGAVDRLMREWAKKNDKRGL